MNVVVNDNVKSACLNMDVYAHCVTIESELKKNFIKKECYETLFQKYHTLEKHCISLEVNNQLKKEIFQRNTVSSPESAPTFVEVFEINDLKAQAQAKDIVILKLKEKLRSLNGDVNERKVKRKVEEIETLNIELDRKVVQIVLCYLDSGCSKHMTGDRSKLVNFVQKFLGTVKFGNDHMAKIMGYGDYQIGNVTISRVYYMEGLGHNLFSVGQFCDSDLEVAFRQHTCFIRNLDRVNLLTGSRGNNLYTLSGNENSMMNLISLRIGRERHFVNTKFLNTLPPEWSKFITDVKLVRDLHTTNIEQLHAYLGQHEYHANESYHQPQFQQQASTYQTSPYATSHHTPQFVSQGSSSSNMSISYPINDISSTVNQNAFMASSSVP
nr:integrase, catalytic region, zinc finger, CCHC-type, peptidase aspartic, catalytic [Tanacetum cinerariifolium]